MQVVQLANNINGNKREKLISKDIREKTQLGTIYVEAMPRWAWGAGLLDQQKNILDFGKFVINFDPLLERTSTQWLMHYYLSSPHGPGPIFWHDLVKTRFRSGDEFSQEEIAVQIGQIYKSNEEKPLSLRSATTSANVFLETYSQSEGLGKLSIIEEISNNRYRVLEPDSPPIWPIALAILDYWKVHFPQQVTVNLNDLTLQSGLANQFMISRSRLEMVLSDMREMGIVELFRVAPPYQVALLNNDPEPIFHRMYSNE